MTEWVEGDWRTVSVGDRVRLTNLDGAEVVIRVDHRTARDYVGAAAVCSVTTRYTEDDWSLFVEASPEPEHKLPTDDGLYQDTDGDVWLLARGRMIILTDGLGRASGHYDERVEEYVPFTRLEPVAETAARVLERVSAAVEHIHYSKLDADTFKVVVMEPLATEFGVNS